MTREETALEDLQWLKTIDDAYKQFLDGAITANECALRLLWYAWHDTRTRCNSYLLHIAAWLVAVVVRNDNRYGW